MSYSRGAKYLLNRFLSSPYTLPVTVATTLGAGLTTSYLLHRFDQNKSVVMHRITPNPEASARFASIGFLQSCLANGKNVPCIFIASLRRQALSSEQAIATAKLAIKNAHIIELEALVKAYPEDITPTLIVAELKQTSNAHTFRELLEAKAEAKLERLRFLFDPKQAFNIVEVNDIKAYFAAVSAMPHLRKTIVMVDSEYYAPSINVQELPPRQINAQGLLLFAREHLRETQKKMGLVQSEPSVVGRHI